MTGKATWSVPDAKARLSELLRRARAGERQIIGSQNPCVVLSLDDFKDLQTKAGEAHAGRWLLRNAPRDAEFAPPARSGDRADPFALD
jgi:prevent-host-death family protein